MIGLLVGTLVFIVFDILDLFESLIAAANRKLNGK